MNETKTSDILVEVAGLGVQRAGRWLVRGVDLRVRRGEIVSLIGPNGGGKTTTAKAILGILRADEGRIDRSENLRIGYVPQRLAVDPTLPLTVLRLMNLTGRYPRDVVIRTLDRVGIANKINTSVAALSGGEFQRALLARAILGNPELLILDEPVQGVDFPGEIALYRLIGDIRDEIGCGILLISHNLHLVMARTDTVVCLNTRLRCAGPPQAIADNPAYEALFGPEAARMLAIYRHRHEPGDGS
ncbi:MAG: metal ABC transporter ATP-binding protein [Pseudomonadota bacterium]|nr:metal ABC transporter ATP-binding protein [Pseudomonadota bacterium]